MMGKTTLVLVMALAACGGGSRDPAADECDALLELVCNRVVECQFQNYTFEMCRDELRMAMGDSMQCEDADQVSAGYPACISDLMTTACADLFPGGTTIALPADCNGAILYEP